jgi:ankyrin repeat protein
LTLACLHGRVQFVELLLQRGANVNVRNAVTMFLMPDRCWVSDSFHLITVLSAGQWHCVDGRLRVRPRRLRAVFAQNGTWSRCQCGTNLL